MQKEIEDEHHGNYRLYLNYYTKFPENWHSKINTKNIAYSVLDNNILHKKPTESIMRRSVRVFC